MTMRAGPANGALGKNTKALSKVASMASKAVTHSTGRVVEPRRAVALARHFRESEGLSIGRSRTVSVARRRPLGRTSTTRRGRRRPAVKARYVGVCRGCGGYIQPRTGKRDAYAYCKRCHPGAIERQWTRDRVPDAMDAWRARYGQLPSSYDSSVTQARRRGGSALERLADGEWPSVAVVTDLFSDWPAARAAASRSN